MPPKAAAAPAGADSDVSDVEDDAKKAQDQDELTSANVTKYQKAAEIANSALKKVVEASVVGAKIIDLCVLGDTSIEADAKLVYNKPKGIAKGIAFPTCVSPNNTICHLSPLTADPEAALTLAEGDSVRIELGAHIDGYIAQVATTIIVGASKENPVTGHGADALQAAYLAIEGAVRLLRPGKTNWDVTDMVSKVAKEFECNAVEGMLSHQIGRNKLDGTKQIILSPSEASRKEIETHTFAEGEAYTLDIIVSSGDGKPISKDTRTTVFKRNTEQTYNLKMKTSRQIMSEITTKCGAMAFSLRQLDDENRARLGIQEMLAHNSVTPYNVLYEKDPTAVVAHFMVTVLMMPTGPLRITGFPWDQEVVRSEKTLKDAELLELIRSPLKIKKKKAKKEDTKA